MGKKDVTTRIAIESFNGSRKETSGTGLFAMVEKSEDDVITIQDGQVSVRLLGMAVYVAVESLLRIAGPAAGGIMATEAVLRAIDDMGSEDELARRDRYFANSAAAELELGAMGDGE